MNRPGYLHSNIQRRQLRDFAAAARADSIEVLPLPDFSTFPTVEEDGATFEANARKKAEHYSALAPGRLLLADDSDLLEYALRRPGGTLGSFCSPIFDDWECTR